MLSRTAYVDLNPLRVAMAGIPETPEHPRHQLKAAPFGLPVSVNVLACVTASVVCRLTLHLKSYSTGCFSSRFRNHYLIYIWAQLLQAVLGVSARKD